MTAHATTEVVDHRDWLGPFFRQLADAWSGFDGVKEYGSLEAQMHLSCTHDERGTVACVVILGQPWPPEWRIEGVLEFGAGARLAAITSDIEAFVAASA